jgi:hypothetical protein
MKKEIDAFSYHNKINFLKHEVELLVTKSDELATSLKRVHAELDELSQNDPIAATQEEQKYYKEKGNPHSETSLEKIGDGG